MNAPPPILRAFSSIALIYHSASLSESQLCFSGWAFSSTWHWSDVWKRDVSGMLFEILQPKKFPSSTRENLRLVRVVEHGHRLPTEAGGCHPRSYSKCGRAERGAAGSSWPSSGQGWDWSSSGGPCQPKEVWAPVSLFRLSSTKTYHPPTNQFEKKAKVESRVLSDYRDVLFGTQEST